MEKYTRKNFVILVEIENELPSDEMQSLLNSIKTNEYPQSGGRNADIDGDQQHCTALGRRDKKKQTKCNRKIFFLFAGIHNFSHFWK